MASTFKLSYYPYGPSAAQRVYDLISGELGLRERSWVTRAPKATGVMANRHWGSRFVMTHVNPVVETFDLVGAADEETLRSEVGWIEEFLDFVWRYGGNTLHHDRGAPELIWQSDGELEKRALILDGELEVNNHVGVTPFLDQDKILARLSLTRSPTWENEIKVSTLDDAILNSVGGRALMIDRPGRVAGRICQFDITTDYSDGLYRYWFGLREPYSTSTTPDYNPVWECEDGDNDPAGGGADVADPAASDGNVVEVTFGTTSLIRRMTLLANDAQPGQEPLQIGRYLVLCRCRLDAAGEVGLELRVGYNGVPMMPVPGAYITNTSYRLIELGEITIPPQGHQTSMTYLDIEGCGVELWAERLSGTCKLLLDCLVMIPADHLLTIVSDVTGVQTVEMTRREDIVITPPPIEFVARDWYLPTPHSILVAAAERETESNINDDLSIDLYYYPRWLIYRTRTGT